MFPPSGAYAGLEASLAQSHAASTVDRRLLRSAAWLATPPLAEGRRVCAAAVCGETVAPWVWVLLFLVASVVVVFMARGSRGGRSVHEEMTTAAGELEAERDTEAESGSTALIPTPTSAEVDSLATVKRLASRCPARLLATQATTHY